VLMISRNELGFDYERAKEFSYTLNDEVFLGAGRGEAQCMPPKAKMMFRAGITYWRTSYRIRFYHVMDYIALEINGIPAMNWQPKILDAGLCELQKNPAKPLFNQPIPIMRNSVPIGQPVPLDGGGGVKQPNQQGVIDPVYLDFKMYEYSSFQDLISNGLGP
jgi:hypothetical protein